MSDDVIISRWVGNLLADFVVFFLEFLGNLLSEVEIIFYPLEICRALFRLIESIRGPKAWLLYARCSFPLSVMESWRIPPSPSMRFLRIDGGTPSLSLRFDRGVRDVRWRCATILPSPSIMIETPLLSLSRFERCVCDVLWRILRSPFIHSSLQCNEALGGFLWRRRILLPIPVSDMLLTIQNLDG